MLKLPSIKAIGLPVLRGLHWVGYGALFAAGYRLDVRRSGELKLGLWRKSWNRPVSKSAGKGESKPKKRGTPRRLVIVPGFGDSPMSWLPVIGMMRPVLRRRYDEIIFLDFPGFSGALREEKAFHSMDLLMETTSSIFDSLKPHTILGHSLGGWLTAHYLAECGSGARTKGGSPRIFFEPKLGIVVNPSGAFADEKNRSDWEGIFRSAIREGFKSIRPHVFKREPFWFRFVMAEFGKFVGQQETIQFMESVREDHLVGPRLKEIQTPTWVVWSEHDTMIPSSAAEIWVREINSGARGAGAARGVILKDVGHSPQLEKPAVTAAVLGQIMVEREPHFFGSRWWQVVELPEEA